MGVKGLQYFADNVGALISVDIACLAADFRQRNETKSVLVVDGMGCLRTFYDPHVPWVYGGQWKQFVDKICSFVDAFRQIGIDLVFIFDGTVEDSKIAEWVKRRNEDLKKARRIFQSIRETSRHPPESLYHLQAGVSSYAAQCLKEYGVTVYSSLIEADRAIFHYYKQHSCFGVLGQDSDYLVFDILNYFSLNSLRIDGEVKVKMYDKMILCTKLQLQPYHLPLLACLMGNDVIPHDKLKRFHQRITGLSSNRMIDLLPAVARYLSGLRITSLTPQVVANLEQQVFGSDFSMSGLMDKVVLQYTRLTESESHVPPEKEQISREMHEDRQKPNLQKSANSSKLADPETEKHSHVDGGMEQSGQTRVLEVIRRAHTNAEINSGLWNAITRHLYKRGPGIEDFTDPNMPSIGTVLQPIRKRIYGLILGVGQMTSGSSSNLQSAPKTVESASHSTSRPTVGVNAIKEWVVCTGQNMTVKPDIIEAEALNMPGGTPSLESLWLQPDIQPLKLQAFLTCMHCQIDAAQLCQLPANLLLPCVLLHYLHHYATPQFFGTRDVYAFLAHAADIHRFGGRIIQFRKEMPVDPRAVHLATLFIRGVSLACLANSACGLPLKMSDMMPWRFFDGKLFHFTYRLAQQDVTIEKLCGGSSIEDYHRMKACVFMYPIPKAAECVQRKAWLNLN